MIVHIFLLVAGVLWYLAVGLVFALALVTDERWNRGLLPFLSYALWPLAVPVVLIVAARVRFQWVRSKRIDA